MYQRREILKLALRQTDRPDAYRLHVSREAMACRFEITLHVSEQSGVKAASAALSEAERLEQQLSVFLDDSESASSIKTRRRNDEHDGGDSGEDGKPPVVIGEKHTEGKHSPRVVDETCGKNQLLNLSFMMIPAVCTLTPLFVAIFTPQLFCRLLASG